MTVGEATSGDGSTGAGSGSGPGPTGGRLRIDSDGLSLAAYLAYNAGARTGGNGVVLCHGFPNKGRGAENSGKSFPELADRLSVSLGWPVLTLNFRGCATSEGNFEIDGWQRDIAAAVAYLSDLGATRVWLVGFGTGGSLCICEGATNPAVVGVAAAASPGDFDDWARHPRALVDHARAIGVIRDRHFPADLAAWQRGLTATRPVDRVVELAPRPLLLLHGSADEIVPAVDPLALADAHGSAEFRMIEGAGHELRHDPRAVAMLTGWLSRTSRHSD
ncbi:MAG: alpha/beta fold hydrolase [Microthrixaceae bacterium]|nr:alpha/beta fold hydrolase [Microthrixaceae bacterium]